MHGLPEPSATMLRSAPGLAHTASSLRILPNIYRLASERNGQLLALLGHSHVSCNFIGGVQPPESRDFSTENLVRCLSRMGEAAAGPPRTYSFTSNSASMASSSPPPPPLAAPLGWPVGPCWAPSVGPPGPGLAPVEAYSVRLRAWEACSNSWTAALMDSMSSPLAAARVFSIALLTASLSAAPASRRAP